MVKNILFGLLVVVALVGCNQDDDEPDVPITYKFNISVTPDDGGTVYPVNDNLSIIYGPIAEGTSVMLKASPSDSYYFKEWQGDLTGTENFSSVEMDSDKTITGVFGLKKPQPPIEGLIYLDNNGVTVRCQDWGQPGQSGELNGIIYVVVDRNRLMQMIENEEDVTMVCTSKITDMSSMCRGPGFNQDISSWDVSNVTDMYAMFFQSFDFNQDISSWDVSNVTNMHAMFYECSFNQDIGSWDVSNVSDMGSMFRGSYRFNQDLSSWDVSNVTDMSYMFKSSDFDQDISSWNVSKVTDMSDMFTSTQFNQDLSAWTVDNVTECSRFSNDTPQWILPKPDFTNCDPN